MINWGILGLGRMGLAFANAISEVDNSNLISIASKSGKKFNKFNNKSYDEIINDKNIDSVYISTLNDTHIELIDKLCDGNKNILCEKPASISLDKLKKVEKKINNKNINFFEAIAYYSHPQTLEVLNLIKNNEIGEIRELESNFGFKARFKPESRLFNKNLGGGSIYDLGCYPISFAMLFTKKPNQIELRNKQLEHAPSGVDNDAKATLICDNNFESKIHVSIKNNLKNFCIIKGSKGFIKILNPWLPEKNSYIEVSSNKHYYLKNINSNLSVYANQIQNVSNYFLGKQDGNYNLFNLEKSLINMEIIDKWVNR